SPCEPPRGDAASEMMRMRRTRAASAAFILLLAGALGSGLAWGYARDKSDMVVLRNGDRISGDIHSLEFGILTLSTDNMSTLSIEWPAVRSVTSKFEFAIERRDGTKYHGVIATSEDGSELVVQSAGGAVRIPMADVERISRFSPRFWDRINGGLSLGFSYTKSSSISVSNVNFNANYRSTAIDSLLPFSSNPTKDSSGSHTNSELPTG